jgi:capsular polysaccharide biosynthesis protein
MENGSDGLEFAHYLRRRWTVPAIACASALLIAGLASVFLPARYTATATILIEPPGGNDPRASTAVSTVYLESLKTYERLASSDTLFVRAIEDLGIRRRYAGRSIESLKRRMLTVSKPASTTIIDISATLGDPRQAQALAQYIAEHTVALNESLGQKTDQEMVLEPQRIFDVAKARREAAEKAKEQFTKSKPVDALEKEVLFAAALRAEIGKDLARARAELANYQGQQQAPASEEVGERQSGWTQLEITATRAKIQSLENQDRQLEDFLNAKTPALEDMKNQRDALDAELKAARADEETANAKLNEVKASAAYRGARLKILDPGIVPQRPSFPNTPLNLVVAFVLALLASLAYLALQFAYGRVSDTRPDRVYSLR